MCSRFLVDDNATEIGSSIFTITAHVAYFGCDMVLLISIHI